MVGPVGAKPPPLPQPTGDTEHAPSDPGWPLVNEVVDGVVRAVAEIGVSRMEFAAVCGRVPTWQAKAGCLALGGLTAAVAQVTSSASRLQLDPQRAARAGLVGMTGALFGLGEATRRAQAVATYARDPAIGARVAAGTKTFVKHGIAHWTAGRSVAAVDHGVQAAQQAQEGEKSAAAFHAVAEVVADVQGGVADVLVGTTVEKVLGHTLPTGKRTPNPDPVVTPRVPLKPTKTLTEHLAFCRQRALEYCERGDLNGAIASLASDMRKHPDTADDSVARLAIALKVSGDLESKEAMREFIEFVTHSDLH